MNVLKKYVVLAMMSLSSIIVVSQNRPFYNPDRTDRFIECDVHGIVGASVFIQDYRDHVPSISDISTSTGCGWGVGATAQFVIRDFFALGTSLDFVAHNSDYSMVLIDADRMGTQNSVFVSNQSFSATVPVFASFRFNLADNVRWNVDAGCYFSLGLGGSQKADTYTTSMNELGQVVTKYQYYKWDFFNEKRPLIHAIDDFDFGLLIGTGLLIHDHYKVGIEARISTKNATTDEGVIHPNVRNHLFAMKLGYQF